MARKQRKPTEPDVYIDGPAVITRDFARSRHISTRAGARKAWERLTVYERQFRMGHLADKEKCKSPASEAEEAKRAYQRRDAAREFDEGWITCNASWPSGFDPDRIRVTGGSFGNFVDHQRRVKQFWEQVRQAMGTNDWMICRRVCGEGWTVAEAVVWITPAYKDRALVRFREALDALGETLDKFRG